MGILLLRINDALDKKFRVKVAEKYGSKRGKLSLAAEEAITLFIQTKE